MGRDFLRLHNSKAAMSPFIYSETNEESPYWFFVTNQIAKALKYKIITRASAPFYRFFYYPFYYSFFYLKLFVPLLKFLLTQSSSCSIDSLCRIQFFGITVGPTLLASVLRFRPCSSFVAQYLFVLRYSLYLYKLIDIVLLTRVQKIDYFLLSEDSYFPDKCIGKYLFEVIRSKRIIYSHGLEKMEFAIPNNASTFEDTYSNSFLPCLPEGNFTSEEKIRFSEDYLVRMISDVTTASMCYPQDNSIRFSTLDVPRSSNNAIIYAHTFSDANFYFGYDGFNGLYDWLCCTTDTLINLGFSVFVKPHPSFDLDNCFDLDPHPSQIFDARIWHQYCRKYHGSITLIDINIRPNDIASLFPPETLHFSHHGTIVPELASLGLKTISSSASPWGSHYRDLSIIYSSKIDFIELMSNFDFSSFLPSRTSVLNYIFDRYYLKFQTFCTNSLDDVANIRETLLESGITLSNAELTLGGSSPEISKLISQARRSSSFLKRLDLTINECFSFPTYSTEYSN